VQEYLSQLVWDGTPRIADVLHNFCNVKGNDTYIKSISRKFFIATAARALSPGCKVDTVLVLQGHQGLKKTSFIEALASNEWYTTMDASLDNKDTRIQATSAWIVEMAEMSSVSKSTQEALKSFITNKEDMIRLPYAHQAERFKRQCTFVGPIPGDAGSRRWWCVACGRIDADGLAKVRDQLWAEAVHCFRVHEGEIERGVPEGELSCRWWFTSDEQSVSTEENSVFQEDEPVLDELRKFMIDHPDDRGPFSLNEVALKALKVDAITLVRDKGIKSELGKALRLMGWVYGPRKHNGPRTYVLKQQPNTEDDN
jgi:predicted P-loop ATPase